MSGPQKLRVLHLHSGNMLGGVESVLLTFAEFAGSCLELKPEFALAFDGQFAESLRGVGATVHVLPEAQLRNPFSIRRTRSALSQLLARVHFDCVISHSPWCQVVFAPAVRRSGVPLIFWMHNDFEGHWLQRWAARHVPDLAICNSVFTQSTLAKVYPATRSHVIYNPVKRSTAPPDIRESLRRELNVTPNEVVMLMASRMEPWKGHRNLIRAAAALKTRNHWTIWIAGAPQTPKEERYFTALQSEVRHQQLAGRIRFLGHRADIPSLMRAADIYCQPNAAPEPFGVVFVEALQASVPLVTFEMGGAREILTESSGMLLPPGDIVGLTNALMRLIDDGALRVRLGAQGPARAKQLCDPVQQIRHVHEVLWTHCNT